MSKIIEYYMSLVSPWSFLGNDQLCDIVQRYNVSIDLIPIDYGQMFAATGTLPLPERPWQRKRYRLVELKRWSEYRGIPLNPQPTNYQGEVKEPDESEAALMVIAAKRANLDSLALANAISRTLWVEDRDPFNRDALVRIAEHLGMDGRALLAECQKDSVRSEYGAYTSQAVDRGVFGIPTYIFDGEMFWGQDRLDFLQRSVAKAMT